MADSSDDIRIVVEGCCHGELDKIYATMAELERAQGIKIDMLICCGDFQAVRNYDDLETMSCPPKYRHLGTFHKYYTGEAVAPYLTLFVGGNHEAANYMWELYHGGWVAPNIYFLGYAGVVNFGGIRIGGISGISNDHHYKLGHFEAPPYNPKTVKSAYHIRELEVMRLLQVEQNELGSAVVERLMSHIQPDYWFAAHLHVKHAALVQHPPGMGQQVGRVTRFLALDKCLPGRDFLQMVTFPGAKQGSSPVLSYDAEWLAILRATHDRLSTSYRAPPLHNMRAPAEWEVEKMQQLLSQRGHTIPENFSPTAPAVPPGCTARRGRMPTQELINPQTTQLLSMLDLNYNLSVNGGGAAAPNRSPAVSAVPAVPSANPEEIELGDEDGDDDVVSEGEVKALGNPEEIEIGEEEDGSLFDAVEIHGSAVADRYDV